MLLWFLCVKIPAPNVFIVQNPPSVPTLVAVKWASWLRRSAFIVDWHNFGYTLLALSLGRSSVFVAIYHWFEKHFGKMANGSLCTTRAMQHELAQNWGIKLLTCHFLYIQHLSLRPAMVSSKDMIKGIILATIIGPPIVAAIIVIVQLPDGELCMVEKLFIHYVVYRQ
ncbi:UDP-glycosyltransferase TURAN-like isoform X2 [Camellia sinensis]|uniref:UDP-glycosyltransferase TURAN-like isoform X2 n=1 Tax=Camellia sinensis TaxID=4442 RepID=UPI001036F245|nr:UDP-glycosyltransferase TURAN-like isoform X2 [Camellia sinensis]